MTATSAVAPGRSASPAPADRSGTRWFRALLPPGRVSPEVTWAAVASAVSAIAGALPGSLAPGTLTAARIAALAGVTEVHHD
jgi:hypothetical protein